MNFSEEISTYLLTEINKYTENKINKVEEIEIDKIHKMKIPEGNINEFVKNIMKLVKDKKDENIPKKIKKYNKLRSIIKKKKKK